MPLLAAVADASGPATRTDANAEAVRTLPHAPHAPHDNVHAIAAAPYGAGGIELVIATSEEEKWLRSVDQGLSWTSLSGDGLELAKPLRAAYWDHPTAPRFALGTDRGVWFYYPQTGAVVAASEGLDLEAFRGLGGRVLELTVPRQSQSTLLLILGSGEVYEWEEVGQRWECLLQTNDFDDRAGVAIAPEFQHGQPTGADQTVLAAIRGRLHYSVDGGASWAVHSQFAEMSQAAQDWEITSLAMHPDFGRTGVILLARGRENLASVHGTEGEVWRSEDFGASFTRVLGLQGSIMRIEDASPRPGGGVHFFLVCEPYPTRQNMSASLGVFRSDDEGRTWDDFGNAQDFLLEKEDFTVADAWRTLVDLCPSPYYAQDGLLFFGRSEGLYRSEDEGNHWRAVRVRDESHVRGIDTTFDVSGDVLAFGATYGSGTVFANLTTETTDVLDEMKSSFQDAVAISPSFQVDGLVAAGGDRGIQFWFDPSKPANNPWGELGWHYDPVDPFGYVRTVELSPFFDASGTSPGSNQAMFWSTRSGAEAAGDPRRTFATADTGKSWSEIDTIRGGHDAPYMRRIVIAPTFDPNQVETRTDVFAASPGSEDSYLYVFWEDEWDAIHSFERAIADLALHPDWARPEKPQLFALLESDPHIALIEYHSRSDVRIKEFSAPGLEDFQVQRLAVPPDFEQRPVLYVSTFGGGVRRLDTRSKVWAWEAVGTNYPALFTEPLALSPNFENDRKIVAGTQDGFLVGADIAGVPWRHLPTPTTVSLKDAGFYFASPNDPANPAPDRAWPWSRLTLEAVKRRYPDLDLVGDRVAFTIHDGAYVEWEGYASTVEFHTFVGPDHGKVLVELRDYWTNALLSIQLVDTDHPTLTDDLWVAVPVPGASAGQPRPVRIRLTAALSPGQSFGLDALSLSR